MSQELLTRMAEITLKLAAENARLRKALAVIVDMSVLNGIATLPAWWKWTTYLALAVQVPPDFDAQSFYRQTFAAALAEAQRRGLR